MLFQSSRTSLSQRIVPPKQTTAPTFPNFFLEIKGPDGTPAGVRRQILHDSLLGAREEKKSHCERTGSFGVSILDNGFIFKRMLTKDWASNSYFAQGWGRKFHWEWTMTSADPSPLTVTESHLLLVPPAKSSVVVWVSSNPSNHLFVYENERQIGGGPRTRTFDTMEGGDDVLGHLLGICWH